MRKKRGRNQEMLQNILEKKRKKKKKHQKINGSRYNNNYKTIVIENFQNIKKAGRKENIEVRYRCGNETKRSHYWREDDDRKCRICRGAEKKFVSYTERT